MTHIPSYAEQDFLLSGMDRLFRGKIREVYALADHPHNLFVVASDRVSVFDHVLPCTIPQKGEILTAMNVFWKKILLEKCGFAHDLVTYGSGIDEFLPDYLKGNPDLQKRATVVEKLSMCNFEAIVRGYLTGSGLAAYQTTNPRELCGHRLPEGLSDGSRLPYALFTPSTKEREGHDKHISAESVIARYGFLPERLSLQLYELIVIFSRTQGILMADTKFEFGYAKGKLKFGDEIGTPDSSRYWDAEAWKQSSTDDKSPPSLDKQFIRDFAKKLGIDKRNPKIPKDVTFVDACVIPAEIIHRTHRIYRYIFWRIVSKKLELFQRDEMEIPIAPPRMRLDLILGSRSDLAQATPALEKLNDFRKSGLVDSRLHIISCHRNPEALRSYAEQLTDADVIVAGAGKAAALPGILKSWLRFFGKSHIPVIGVAFEGSTNLSSWAAKLSIEELPEQPIVLNEEGAAYQGETGCLRACERAVHGEFLLDSNWRVRTEPEFDVNAWK